VSQAIRTRRIPWIFGALACLVLLGTIVSYERLLQLYLRYRLKRHPEELRAYALSDDANKREAIRLFASTPQGARRIGAALMVILCDGRVRYGGLPDRDWPATCSGDAAGKRVGPRDVGFVLARQQDRSESAWLRIEEYLWNFSHSSGGVELETEAMRCAAVLMSALCGKSVFVEGIGDGGLILEVTQYAESMPHDLIPVVPCLATLRAHPKEKLERFSEMLLDRSYFDTFRMLAAKALGRLRTPEAIQVLERALRLDDLDADIRAAVEEAIQDAPARSAE
jgi:hypothetical protein